MRAWRVVGKYPVIGNDGQIANTIIQLVSTAGGEGSYTETVIGDHTKKTDSELIELAREAFFKSEYSNRAMAEAVQKVEALELAATNATKTMQDLEKRLTDSEAERNKRFLQLEEEHSSVQGALLEFTTEQVPLLMSLLPLLSLLENKGDKQDEGTQTVETTEEKLN